MKLLVDTSDQTLVSTSMRGTWKKTTDTYLARFRPDDWGGRLELILPLIKRAAMTVFSASWDARQTRLLNAANMFQFAKSYRNWRYGLNKAERLIISHFRDQESLR